MKAKDEDVAIRDALADWLDRKVEARCLSCGGIVHLCFDERTSGRWTHYGCGRVHFGKQYEESLKRKSV